MSDRKDHYRELERVLTVFVFLALAAFLGYLVCAIAAWTLAKYLLAAVVIGVSGFGIWMLYNTKELFHHRSRWITYAFGSMILCSIVSMICNFP